MKKENSGHSNEHVILERGSLQATNFAQSAHGLAAPRELISCSRPTPESYFHGMKSFFLNQENMENMSMRASQHFWKDLKYTRCITELLLDASSNEYVDEVDIVKGKPPDVMTDA